MQGQQKTAASSPVAETGKERPRHARYARYRHDNPQVINEVVDPGLCVRCGACEPACPFDIIRFRDDHYPYITDIDQCPANCIRCLKACPGAEVDFNELDDRMFGKRPHPDSITGIVQSSWVGHSTDDEIRARGASGGLVTGLLKHLLADGSIDGALVLGTKVDEKGWRQEPFIARSAEELEQAAQSKYMIAPMLKPLREIEQQEGRYAVVALPCYAHALQRYLKVSPKLRKRLALTIGLYCNVALEPHLLSDLAEMSGIAKERVTGLDFRSGEWPGGVHARIDDGEPFKLLKHEEMKDEFNTLKMMYTPPRCNMCIDFSAEYTDIAVGDPWLRGPDGSYLFPDGRTTILVRTDEGARLLQRAVDGGAIELEELPLDTFMVNFEKSARYKRELVPDYIEVRRRAGLAVPDYGRDVAPHLKTTGWWKLGRGYKAAILHTIADFKWARKLFVRIAQTPPAIRYFRWNRGRKTRKFAAGYASAQDFVKGLRKHHDDQSPPAP